MYRSLHCCLFVVNLVSFSALSYFAFSRNYAMLAYGSDGGYLLLNVMQQWNWTELALGFFANPFQGLGDLWFFLNVRLIPSYVLPMLLLGADGELTKSYVLLSYCSFAAEMFICTWLLALALGLDWAAALGSAWTFPLLAHPYFGYSLLYPILQLSPNFGTMMSEYALLIGATYLIGKDKAKRSAMWACDAGLGVAILLLLVILLASQPLLAVLWVLSFALIALALILVAPQRERNVKIATLAGIGLFLVVAGPALYLYGMFSFTVARYFPEALENAISAPVMVSIAYGDGSTGPYGPQLFAAGIAGSILAAIFGERSLRAIAVATLLSAACLIAAGHVFLHWDFWRGPAPIYFEFPIWALYVIFAWWGAAFVVQMLLRLVSGHIHRIAKSIIAERAALAATVALSVALPVLALASSRHINDPVRQFPYPPSKPPMIALLQQRVGLFPGSPFRGRVESFELLAKSEPIGWMDLGNKYWPRNMATGNEYHGNGLWYNGIPTLFEYSQSMSPAFFRVVTKLLARQGDKQLRNVVVLRRADARALALLGVRFVIADAELHEPFRKVMTEETYDGEMLFLYEVPDVNLGLYSPTQAIVAHGFDEAIVALSKFDFDFKRSFVTFDPAISREPLGSVGSARLRIIPGGYAVEATSAGTALLLLPFEFSQCLRIRDLGPSSGESRLLRVNAVETGILFKDHLSAEIGYFTGPFRNSSCRVRDSWEFSKLLNSH